ncbi:MAG: aminotransferase class I/II-fold pyridoxal phosphate-dependent enzyme [Eubacterium sp.]|nr:aminotransferase class I/II-fold pyridoxal phosphate-dependent enzyme [Eubacterium sp.]
MGFNTRLLHAGVVPDENGATLTPIYQNTAFAQESARNLEGIFENKKAGYCYTRVGNPTVSAFENRITKLEGGIASVACASGMAALTAALLNILNCGDELISSASLYGGTIDLFRDLKAYGITTRYVRTNDWTALEEAFTERTKLVFAETIGNPCLDVTDLERLSEIAHKHHVPLIVDNTTATPYLIQALEHGADIVVNSSSKYINGSSNSISGILTDKGRFPWDFEKYPGLKAYKKYGPMCYVAKLRGGLFRNMGACLAPMNAYLNMIGMETLGLRMKCHCENAKKLAEWMEAEYPNVQVRYPGLKSSPWYEVAQRQFDNGFGAILTLRLGSKERAFAFIDHLKLAYNLSNIGDSKTLVIHPASTISLHSTQKEREDAGVYDDLVRVSVGIEDIEDIIEDFKNAFSRLDEET